MWQYVSSNSSCRFFQTPSYYFIADAVGWNLPLDHFLEGFQSTINISHLCITTNQGIEGSDVRLKTMSFQLSHPVLESVGTHIASFRIWVSRGLMEGGRELYQLPRWNAPKTHTKKKGVHWFIPLPSQTPCFSVAIHWSCCSVAAPGWHEYDTNQSQSISESLTHWIERCTPKTWMLASMNINISTLRAFQTSRFQTISKRYFLWI